MLKRDRPPPGFDAIAMEREVRNVLAEKVRDNHRFSKLFESTRGFFGCRPGNAWGLSRRKWIERFVRIKTKGGLIVPLILNASQRQLEAEILRMERAGVPVRIIILKARQQGFSTYIAALEFWYSCTHAHGRSCIIAHKRDISKVIFEKLVMMLTEMKKNDGSPWLLHASRKSQGQLHLGDPINGQVIVESAEVDEPLRGETIQVLHISEGPIWPDADRKADAVAQALPDEVGTYGFNEATANGDSGWFAREFRRAWRENRMGRAVQHGWRGFFAPWYWDQTYRWSHMTGSPPDADLALAIGSTLTAEETALLQTEYTGRRRGAVKVDLDQRAWRRHTIREKCRNSLDAFHQEYPATPDEAFLSSGQPFFEPLLIARERELGVREPVFVGELVDLAAEAKMSRRPVAVGEIGNSEEL